MISLDGAVVQLVRTPACHAGGRGFKSLPRRHLFAAIAQSVERILGKDEVPSSNLGSSSRETRCPARDSGFFHLSGGETAQQETHTETHTDRF